MDRGIYKWCAGCCSRSLTLPAAIVASIFRRVNVNFCASKWPAAHFRCSYQLLPQRAICTLASQQAPSCKATKIRINFMSHQTCPPIYCPKHLTSLKFSLFNHFQKIIAFLKVSFNDQLVAVQIFQEDTIFFLFIEMPHTYNTRAIINRSRLVTTPLRFLAKRHFLHMCFLCALRSRQKKIFA